MLVQGGLRINMPLGPCEINQCVSKVSTFNKHYGSYGPFAAASKVTISTLPRWQMAQSVPSA